MPLVSRRIYQNTRIKIVSLLEPVFHDGSSTLTATDPKVLVDYAWPCACLREIGKVMCGPTLEDKADVDGPQGASSSLLLIRPTMIALFNDYHRPRIIEPES